MKNAQRETTLRPPLRRRCAMGEPLTFIGNCGDYGNVMRKLVVEGGWVRKRLHDVVWSDENKCLGCNEEEGTEKHRLYHKSEPRGMKEMGAWSKNVRERIEEANPLIESQQVKSNFGVQTMGV